MKPIINLEELKFVADGPDVPGMTASVSGLIGAKKLAFNVSLCPPGKSVCPFHSHRINEEMIFIIEGQGQLRFGDQVYSLRAGDFVAFPPGGPELAHQVINTGEKDLKYIALSTNFNEDICEYPDSQKIGVFAGELTNSRLRKLFQVIDAVPYATGETSPILYKK